MLKVHPSRATPDASSAPPSSRCDTLCLNSSVYSQMRTIRFHIRSLTAADESQLWPMLYHAIYAPAGQSPPPPAVVHRPELARYVQHWGRAGDGGFLIHEGAAQEPVGAVWVRLFPPEFRGYGYLADDIPELSMAVVPGHRGQGAGTQLLRRLVESEYGLQPISLSVSAENPAVRLYKRFDFQVVHGDATSLVMRRDPA